VKERETPEGKAEERKLGRRIRGKEETEYRCARKPKRALRTHRKSFQFKHALEGDLGRGGRRGMTGTNYDYGGSFKYKTDAKKMTIPPVQEKYERIKGRQGSGFVRAKREPHACCSQEISRIMNGEKSLSHLKSEKGKIVEESPQKPGLRVGKKVNQKHPSPFTELERHKRK